MGQEILELLKNYYPELSGLFIVILFLISPRGSNFLSIIKKCVLVIWGDYKSLKNGESSSDSSSTATSTITQTIQIGSTESKEKNDYGELEDPLQLADEIVKNLQVGLDKHFLNLQEIQVKLENISSRIDLEEMKTSGNKIEVEKLKTVVESLKDEVQTIKQEVSKIKKWKK